MFFIKTAFSLSVCRALCDLDVIVQIYSNISNVNPSTHVTGYRPSPSVSDMEATPSKAVCLYALLSYCLSPPLLIETLLYSVAENNTKQIRHVIWGTVSQ